MTYDSLQGPKSFKSKDSSSLKQEEINFLISRLFCSNHSDFKSIPLASEAAHRFWTKAVSAAQNGNFFLMETNF